MAPTPIAVTVVREGAPNVRGAAKTIARIVTDPKDTISPDTKRSVIPATSISAPGSRSLSALYTAP